MHSKLIIVTFTLLVMNARTYKRVVKMIKLIKIFIFCIVASDPSCVFLRAEIKLSLFGLKAFTFLHPWLEKSNFTNKRKRPKHFTKINFWLRYLTFEETTELLNFRM